QTAKPRRTTALTDSQPRPAANENYLLISAFATHPDSPLLAVSRRIADSGCNLIDARLATVRRDVSVLAPAQGAWDAGATSASGLARLEREERFRLAWYRTGPEPAESNLLPSIVEVSAADRPGIAFQLAHSFARQATAIERMQCSRYPAMQ